MVTNSQLLERFQTVVMNRLGLSFDESRLGFLENILRSNAGREPLTSYLHRLESDPSPAMLDALARELTVTETYFFRHSEQLKGFAEVALPDRAALGRRVSLLSAGCSSGEEPYTLGILSQGTAVSLQAFDLNPAALERARLACYSPWSLRETPPEIQRRWFTQNGRDLCLDPAIKSLVRFEKRNLMEEDPDFWRPGSFDIIFCRNVLMYFPPERARGVVERIARSLSPGGYLFLGYAENLRGLSQDFHLCQAHEAFFYQRKDALVRSTTPPILDLSPVVEESQSWVEVIGAASERIAALSERARQVPPDTGLRLSRAQDLLRQERFGDALEQIRDLPEDPDVSLLRAVLLSHSGDLNQAEEICRQMLEQDELTAGAHYVLALCREAAGDRQSAVTHNQMAGHLDPGFAMPRLQLGLLARRSGDQEGARRELGRALALLQREEPSRLLMFGGGFSREALLGLCRSELKLSGGTP